MDAALAFDATTGEFDLSLEASDLATEDGLRGAVVVSLFSDARAQRDARLPAEASDRRGFWADSFTSIADDQTGSLLWLISRELNREQTRVAIEEHARNAVDWLVQDGVARSVKVSAEIQGDDSADLTVEIFEPAGTRVEFRFTYVWESV